MSEIRDLSHSTAPDDSYLDEMARQTRARAEQAAEWASGFTGAPEASRSVVAEGLNAAEGDLTGLLHTIHGLAETAFEEFDSVAAIASVLDNHGVDVETGL
ncbi:MAG: amidohydrolase, partial [Brevibacterium linens]